MRPHRLALLPLVAAAATPSAAQQLRVATASPLPQATASVFICSQSRSLAPGPVGSPTVLRVSAPCTYFGEYANGILTVTPDFRAVRLVADAESFTASAIPASASVAGAIDVDVVGTTQGTLVVTYAYATNGSLSSDELRVDVGADGIAELVIGAGLPASGQVGFPLTVTGSLRTSVRLSVGAAGRDPLSGLPHRSTIDVSLRFVPSDAVTFDDSAPGCATTTPVPRLAGTDTRAALGHRVDLTVDHAMPNAFVALVFATRTGSTPIPIPPWCAFDVDPLNWLLLVSDASGHASIAIGLPPTLPPGLVHAQAATFDMTPRAWTSNRLDVTLWP